MKELLEERRDRKTKPNNKLFIGKIHHVVGKVNRRQSFTVCQLDQDIVQNKETNPEFLFRQDTNWMVQSKALDSGVFPSTLLRPSVSASRSGSSSCHYAKWIWVVWKPMRDNALIRINHLTHLPFSVALTIQQETQMNQKFKPRRIGYQNLQSKYLSQ